MKPLLSIVFTDFDGTLFTRERKISEPDYDILVKLGKSGITRVIATGRSVYSISKVISDDFPVDYLIFSSGSGILDWKNKILLHSCHLYQKEIQEVGRIFFCYQVDFMIHDPIPENHRFHYKQFSLNNHDFIKRCDIYRDYVSELTDISSLPDQACQFVGIIDENKDWFDFLSGKLLINSLNIKLIRTTSPINGRSIWMEVFPGNVSKASAAALLCEFLSIDQSRSMSIGNDYNDSDLLAWTAYSFVVEGSPDELITQYRMSDGEQNSALANAVNSLIVL
ncbi:MAG: HAD hydrolase family protein [Bacteroidia bacterium]|nr:HAD hydrolase family protein [Bacteroidia bacterium]